MLPTLHLRTTKSNTVYSMRNAVSEDLSRAGCGKKELPCKHLYPHYIQYDINTSDRNETRFKQTI